MWKNFYCTNKNCRTFLGLQNNTKIIFGGTIISQNQTNVMCSGCRRIVKKYWSPKSVYIRFVSEKDILAILESDGYISDDKMDYKNHLEKITNLS